MRKLFGFCLFLLFFSISQVSAQPYFVRTDTITVKQNNQFIKNPWAGGLNACQFSEMDLNLDGIKDLFVFDRSINKIRTFINGGTVNQVDYKHAPQYESLFPVVHDWALLKDYDADGRVDIFTYSSGGFAVYKNISTPQSGLLFQKISNQIKSNYNPTVTNLYVSSVDLPAFTDVDRDGDMDVITFGIVGSTVEFHENLSMQTYAHADSLIYKLKTGCWGNFEEDAFTCKAYLNISCKGPGAAPDTTLKPFHSGSTVTAFDMDCDNDDDLVIGDISCYHMYSVINGGSTSNAQATAIDTVFPQNNTNTTAIDIDIFPAAFFLDVNNDTKKDMVVSPNAYNVSENFESVWWYQNSAACGVEFEFKQSDFLQDQMIELGSGAYPAFVDFTGDGLIDILIGNQGYFNGGGNLVSKIAAYKNIGTLSNPSFELVTDDYFNLSQQNYANMYPAFGDLDNDGDKDMLIGTGDGRLHYYSNTAGPGNPFNLTLTEANYKLIDVGNFATPQIIDVNRDGKLDLLIGKQTGAISYYRNTGTVSNALFTPETTTFGNVDVQYYCCTGYSTPLLVDVAGSYKLLSGSEFGSVFMYTNIDGNLSGTFTKADTNYMNVQEGQRIALASADINNDGMLDFAVGNYGGGVALYMGVATNPVSVTNNAIHKNNISIFPNPVHDQITILSVAKDILGIETVMYDVRGTEVLRQLNNGNKIMLNVSELNNGIYVIVIRGKDMFETHKIIVNH